MGFLSSYSFWEFVLRWFHFLAGITWIGLLYYFNFVQTPYFKSGADKAVVNAMTRGLVPTALWWFRWGAMFTFLTGWTIVFLRLGGAAPGGPMPHSSQTLILVGGLMGTVMWANVWFVIWPAQQVVIRSAEQVHAGGEPIPEAADLAARAGFASRTNTLLSFSLLLFMGAQSHASEFLPVGDSVGAFLGAAVALLILIELNVFFGNAATRKPLGSVKGVIIAGFVTAIVYFLLARLLLA